ncbi:MAG: DUF624 domain-containing protein [Oscillospiraceae bacterium]|nr:DUF624 domain-containing protein [Oscillospiraceae bacterium]
MAFLGFGADYEKAGQGIAKGAPRKKPFFEFLDMYFGRFWKMLKLSLLTTLFCLPIVTIGPALTGMTKVLKSYSLDKDTFMWHDFIKGFTGNLRQSLPAGLIDILCMVSLVCALNVYPALAESGGGNFYYVLCVISVSFALTVFMMNFYAFPMIAAIDLPFKSIIKNSFYLVCLGLKKSVLTLVIIMLTIALLAVGTVVNPLTLVLVPLWAVSFMGFVSVFNSYPLIQKYVIDPYYEERGETNPEYDYLKPLDAEDAVFLDRGGEEAPVEGSKEKKKKKKGKTIS